jgi:UDP-N-acetylglucosamine--N-acetylmuramyl-(pentapeptide) pyrophosphoryl-undecaprenol N-acetylglucosamine transferase
MGPPSDVTTRPSIFAVLTGGGTSGHVVPALALAELLIEDGVECESLHYLGTRRGVEGRLVPTFGLSATYLDVEGLRRRFTPSALVRNLRVLVGMYRARESAKQLLRVLAPRVVVSVGGYGSVPGCSAAKSLGIPVVTCSYDRRPGLATRRQSRYAAAVAVAHLPSELPRATLTGAPVRAAFRHLRIEDARAGARTRLGLPLGGLCVAVIGGSLGSRVLNVAATKMNDVFDGSVSILHITGDRYLDESGGAVVVARPGGEGRYVRIGSSESMDDVYAAADLVVSRAGASTVAEVATVGVAAIFVPWKDAAEDHQTANASWLVDEGAAALVVEDDSVLDHLLGEVQRLLGDEASRSEMARRAHSCGTLHRQAGHAALIRSVAT